MDSPSLSWSSAYSQPTERLRSAARMVGVQQPHFDQADSMTQTNFFPQFPIGSGFSFHELDYRLQEVTSAQHPVAVVEHSPCVPTAFTQPEGLQKYIPDVKPFTHYTARRRPTQAVPSRESLVSEFNGVHDNATTVLQSYFE
ncbi:unnamed protein product [Nippostrongylus brasiliensis]|uniref:Uncharacterized protein n=1 Tax=Nippostrongylus brasiliensis TaxID=27835 RepID=A0A0N4Y0K0_NIPBR|nr:unnamed protein product [Nippostrongylus brasiliensis]